jgi:hypothetical protein
MNFNRAGLAQYCGIDDPNDAQMLQLAHFALAYLTGETHRYFGLPSERVSYLVGSGTNRLWLDDTPIETPAVLESFGGDPGVAVTDFVVRGRALVRSGSRQWGRRYEYVVSYEAGYATLPEDIEAAVYDLVRWKLEYLKKAPGLGAEKLGDYGYTRTDVDGSGASWVPAMNATIQRWKRNPI